MKDIIDMLKLIEAKQLDSVTFNVTPRTKIEGTKVDFVSQESEQILGVQLKKVNLAAKMLGISWHTLIYKTIDQGPHYMDYQARQNNKIHKANVYALVGTTKKGTEVSYYKYEGNVAGGSKSMLVYNKDPKSSLPLSTVTDYVKHKSQLASSPGNKHLLGITKSLQDKIKIFKQM
jgi:NADH:ubiquinone oxidoreductase subunit